MQRWLLKTEPGTFSIDDLAARKVEPWDGVRNYQARNFIRAMRPGDAVLIYHSVCATPGVVGIAKIAAAPRPDPTQFDPKNDHYDPASKPDNPRWTLVDVRFGRKLRRTISLHELKASPGLGGLALVQRGSRLSVMPVSDPQWHTILALE